MSRPQATALFTLFRRWLAEQFTALGLASTADEKALHVLAFSQGAATLANAFGDEDFVRREVDRLEDWLAAQLRPAENSPQ